MEPLKINYERVLFCAAIAFILFIILAKVWLTFVLPLGFDEAGASLIAKGILQGKDLFDHKPPLFNYSLAAFINIFGSSAVAIHQFALALDLILGILIFIIALNYFGKIRATLALAIYLALSFVFGPYFTSEVPSAIFGLIGIFMYLKSFDKDEHPFLFISGIFIAVSIWFNQLALMFFLGIIIHQIYLLYNKQKKFSAVAYNIISSLFGILIVSLPLLAYFLIREGDYFLFKIITFNLLFKGSTSRILSIGKALSILISNLGLLFLLLFASATRHKKEFKFITISITLFVITFMVSPEFFYHHLFQLIPLLILGFFFSIENYSNREKQIAMLLIILMLLIPTLTTLEQVIRSDRAGDFDRQEEFVQYLKSEIPEDAKLFSDDPIYQTLLNKDVLYKITGLAPSYASVFDLSDFCEKSENWDYIIFTHRKKFLPEEQLNCTLRSFVLIKRFDNIGESYVELYKKA